MNNIQEAHDAVKARSQKGKRGLGGRVGTRKSKKNKGERKRGQTHDGYGFVGAKPQGNGLPDNPLYRAFVRMGSCGGHQRYDEDGVLITEPEKKPDEPKKHKKYGFVGLSDDEEEEDAGGEDAAEANGAGAGAGASSSSAAAAATAGDAKAAKKARKAAKKAAKAAKKRKRAAAAAGGGEGAAPEAAK